jgi:quercetin dioxygenase-like cupin family protein
MTYHHRRARDVGTRDEDWGSLTWLADRATTGNRGLTLGRVVIKKGQANPRHRHNSCEEVLYLLSGRLRHSIGDAWVDMEPGDVLHIPAGIYHNGECVGEGDADMIVAYSTGERDFELERVE